ncbi:MAG: efflux RND transporter permease subunit [Prolixibacteraceae bacterium]|nr:efflux RND transporter permease subunit [Prolixibacteraceae bacterium]
MPGLHVMRSKNSFGLSAIILVFEDGVDDYWARQRVQERITEVDLPYGASPGLNPLTSPTGEIFRYIIESKNHDLRELTELHKWVIIPRLKQVTGVAGVIDKIEKNNSNAGGSMLNRGDLRAYSEISLGI